MSQLSPSQTYYSEKGRYNTSIGTAGRYRVNIQIGADQFHVVIQLPESRTFNYIMDELQPVFNLSEYQRVNTRIYLQTILGETEILVNSRPNYGTDRNIDYIGIPANPAQLPSVQRNGGIWLCFTIILLFAAAALAAFIGVEFFLLRPRLLASVRLPAISSSPAANITASGPITAGMVTPVSTPDRPTMSPSLSSVANVPQSGPVAAGTLTPMSTLDNANPPASIPQVVSSPLMSSIPQTVNKSPMGGSGTSTSGNNTASGLKNLTASVAGTTGTRKH